MSSVKIMGTFTVLKLAPEIEWGPLQNITHGTKIDNTQLTAVAVANVINTTEYVNGVFEYDVTKGALLPEGEHTITCAFFPSNSQNYYKSIKQNKLIVTKQNRVEQNALHLLSNKYVINIITLDNNTHYDYAILSTCGGSGCGNVVYIIINNTCENMPEIVNNILYVKSLGVITISAIKNGDIDYLPQQSNLLTIRVENFVIPTVKNISSYFPENIEINHPTLSIVNNENTKINISDSCELSIGNITNDVICAVTTNTTNNGIMIMNIDMLDNNGNPISHCNDKLYSHFSTQNQIIDMIETNASKKNKFIIKNKQIQRPDYIEMSEHCNMYIYTIKKYCTYTINNNPDIILTPPTIDVININTSNGPKDVTQLQIGDSLLLNNGQSRKIFYVRQNLITLMRAIFDNDNNNTFWNYKNVSMLCKIYVNI